MGGREKRFTGEQAPGWPAQRAGEVLNNEGKTKEEAFTHMRNGSSHTPTFMALLHSLDFFSPVQGRGIFFFNIYIYFF